MAAEEERHGARMHERLFDKVGRRTLDDEVRLIRGAWPGSDILTLRPNHQVLAAMRPNPLDPDLAVPAFVRTLIAMKKTLADPEHWSVLERHLAPKPAGRRP
jgi:hypothetical protein